MPKKTDLIIPCFNEVDRLKDSFIDSLVAAPEFHLILVDDGSLDGTAARLRTFAAAHPSRVSVLESARNAGKGEAVRQGVLAAIKQQAEIIGYADSDGATPASECLRLCACLEQSDDSVAAVFGSRVKLLGLDIRRKLSRHLSGRVFATAASRVLALPVYDTQCGIKYFRNTHALRQAFSVPFHSRWIFDVEILGRLALSIRRNGGRPEAAIHEIPLQIWHDIEGSKRRLWDYGRVAVDLCRIARSLSRERF